MDTRIVGELMVLSVLGISAQTDYRNKKVCLWLLALYAAFGVVYSVWFPGVEPGDAIIGAALGGAVVVLSFLTRGGIGTGDGILLCVTGLYLGAWENLALFAGGLVLCGLYCVWMIVIRKKGRKYEVAFVPFLLLAYVAGLAGG
ncbi:MAG: prepilin peptidase [Eubacterium sp.]|nr:prepilin peptidase [Eubacterium sp.]